MWRWVAHLLIKHRQFKFREWIDLEDRKIKIAGASDKNKDEFPKLVIAFLSDALSIIPKWVWARMFWVDTITCYTAVANALSLRQYLPLISLPYEEKKLEEPPWQYPGRTWFYYSRLLASAFGWTLEYIAQLPPYTAMALIQELMLDEQIKREFQWSMSEASVSFDPKTKVTKPNPLPRPYWMTQAKPNAPLPIPRIKIPKHLIPIGVVNNDSISAEYQPKEIEPATDERTGAGAERGGT